MDTMTTLKKWEDEAFTLVKKAENPMVRYTGQFAERAAEFVPTRPTFMAEMPKVAEMVEFMLKLQHRMVGEQTRFVHSMMKAMDPVIVKFETMPKPAKPQVTKSQATKPKVTRAQATKPKVTKMTTRKTVKAA